MLRRMLQLHPSTYQRLIRLSKEAEKDGAYRVAKRLRAVILNSQGHIIGELAKILQAPRPTYSTGSRSFTYNYTYYDTSTPNTVTGPNRAVTTYVYGSSSCKNSFPTLIEEPLGLSRSIVWNCTGGVPTQVTDENGNLTTASFTDPNFWRPTQTTDQESNATTISYHGATSVESSLSFNSGGSVSDVRTTVDGYGRPAFTQQRQGPGATDYDTVEVDYNSTGQADRTTLPYSAAASPSSSNASASATNKTFDALGRVLTVTKGDGGTISYTYTNNDVLKKVSGSQTFQKQFEYDGLGRLTSVCEISSSLPGVASCNQGVSQNGYLTKYTYDGLGHLLTVTQNAQPSGSTQTRSFAYDLMGRMTSEKDPETGTFNYFWDAYPTGCKFSASFPGNLAATEDNAQVFTCNAYDQRNRLVGANTTTSNNCRGYIYDTGTAPSGVTVLNGKGRMIAAYTNSACNGRNSLVVDEWFSYSPRGEVTDVYQSSPHSGGYYHTSQSYWPSGAVESLSSSISGIPTFNDGASGSGLDGEGRYLQISASSGTSPIATMSYSTSGILGGLSNITFGSGDAENFSYNPSTGRITGFQMVVNGAADTGTLTWNSNGTLGQMAISDGISGSTDSETCNYGYDDLARQSSVNCGTGWAQNFSYDAFGNIAKTVPSGSTGSAFSPTYSSATNQFTSIPGVTPGYDCYDLDGRLLTDNVSTYTWDPWGDLATVNGSAAETYDAFGHLVETNFGELVYGPSGKWLAIASGSTLLRAFMPLAAGSRAVYGSSGLLEYMTADWEGSDRLASTPSRTASTTEYAPFGETYGSSGDDSYTGQLQTTVTSLLDFPARRYSPSQGRWISPDPLGVGAVTQTNPQSWNRYAYVLNNPAAFIDPMGLEEDVCDDESTVCFDGFSGDGGDDGGGGAPPDCNAPDTACVNGNPPSCDPSDTTCQVQNPGISQPIPGSPTNPQTPINVPSLINNAKGLLSQRCKSKFGQKIPGYTTSRFFNTLSNATINQYPFATPPQDSSSYGADAVTHPPGGPIDLLPNFYGRDPTSQAFVLIHEGIHLFGRGNLGDSAVQNLFGLPVTGNTENITQYIAAGCYP